MNQSNGGTAPAAAARCGMLATVLLVWAGASQAQGIYTCVDSKGRKITSDRPIAECNDREQRELSNNGLTLRKVKPVPTAPERAAEEARQQKIQDEERRLAEERRRDRALLARYPSQAAHDRERASALKQVDDVVATASKRNTELQTRQTQIDAELEFYRKDPSKRPVALVRQIDEHKQNLAAHKRFLTEQEGEKLRVNARFDEELAQLRRAWSQAAAAPGTPGVTATPAASAPSPAPAASAAHAAKPAAPASARK